MFLDIINRDQNSKNDKDKRTVPKQQNFIQPKIPTVKGSQEIQPSSQGHNTIQARVIEAPGPQNSEKLEQVVSTGHGFVSRSGSYFLLIPKIEPMSLDMLQQFNALERDWRLIKE